MSNHTNLRVMLIIMISLCVSSALVGAQEDPAQPQVDPAQQYEGKTPDATLDLDEVQIGYLIMGTMGGGTLHYQGQDYRFKLGGLGAGGAGAAKLEATGDVFGLNDVADFAGEYLDARIGLAATIKGRGHLWLKNTKGVHLHLKTHLEGLALTLGADAITITLDE